MIHLTMFSAPSFWNSTNLSAVLLLPLSGLYLLLGKLRNLSATPYHSKLPVICVGNITVGGTGKTPLVDKIATLLAEQGYHSVILSRGYGGSVKKPTGVDPSLHDSAAVGDEALMLSQSHQVVVARDRAAGAVFIERNYQADVILMDDGMQNPWLFKDIILGVFDGQRGLQNGLIFPAGPLRQTLQSALPVLDMLLINGEDATELGKKCAGSATILHGELEPSHLHMQALKDTKWLAFAGIGNPNRFFTMIERQGLELVSSTAFADHHPFSEADLTQLQADASHRGAELVTTLKDWIRLPAEWRERVHAISVSLTLSEKDTGALERLILSAITNKQKS